MKKLISFTALLVGLSSSAMAFSINAECTFNQANGHCIVWNNFNRPIFCHIQARALTSAGFWADIWENGLIYPGQSGYANINANNPYVDPIVHVEGHANCNF